MASKPIILKTDAEMLDRLTKASQGRGKNGTVVKADLEALLMDHAAVVGRLHPDEYREPEEVT
ncbi:MAG: hypothetical protein AAF608_05140 [Pseudomonadota bacterium]